MKFSKVLVFLLAATLILPACGKGSNSSASNQSSASPQDASGKSEQVDQNKLPQLTEISTVLDIAPDAKLPAGDTVEDNQITRYFTEKTNVKFKILWHASGSSFQEKLKLAIASDDLPDVFQVDEKTFRSLADAGQIQDLTEVFNKYASPVLKDLYASSNNAQLKGATVNGKLMAIPNITVQADAVNLLWVRQDWLDKLKLQAPKTIDDVAKIAKAFIEQDPDGNGKADTIGITGKPSDDKDFFGNPSPYEAFRGIFNAFGAYPKAWLKDDSGKIYYGSTTEQTKQALGKLQEWYKEGLIDKEFPLNKDYNQLIASGKSGLFFHPWWAPWWPLPDSIQNNPKADWKAYPIADANGKYNSLMLPVSRMYTVVKKGYEHPEAVAVYLNSFVAYERGLDKEGESKIDQSIFSSYYPLFETYDYADAVARKNGVLTKVIDGKMKPEELNPEMKKVYDQYLKDKANPKSNPADWSAPTAYLVGGGALNQDFNEVYSAFTSTTPTMERKGPNLIKLETDMFLQIVVKGDPLDRFDQFVKDWKAQGGDEITSEIAAQLNK